MTHPDGEKIITVDRLNEAMDNKEWYEANQDYFILVGYRIPSQALNSAAYLKIKNFLSEETMNLVVLPSAITKIAGSDFDIDKMNIIRPYITKDGKIITPLSKRREKTKVLAELEKVKNELNSLQPPSYIKKIEDLKRALEQGTLDLDKNLFEHNILYLQQEEERVQLQIDDLKSSFEEDETLKTPEKEAELEDLETKAQGIALIYSTFLSLKKNKEFAEDNLEDLVKDTDMIMAAMPDSLEKYEKEKERLLARYQELIIEAHHQKRAHGNNIFNVAVAVLKRPDSFYNMVSPNSVEILENLADDIKGLLETSGKRVFMSSKSSTHLFNPVYNNEVYNAFMGSKKGLSIAALAAPLYQLFQRSGAYLNDVYTLNDKKYETLVYLNVNRNEEGKPSLSAQKSSDGENLTSEIISQYISAYVDAANNPFIFYMNGSLKVAPTLVYMAFLGVPIKQAVYLANQDSIRNYVGRLNSLDSYIRKYDNKAKGIEYKKLDVLIEIWNLYKPSHYAPLMAEDISSMSQFYRKVQTQIKTIQSPMKRGKMDVFKMEDAFDANVLRENIAAKSNSPNYKEINFYAFLQYVELENQSAALREVTSELKFDTNLFKSTSAANYSFKKLVRMMNDNSQILPKEIFNNIAQKSEISPYKVHEVIKYLYKDLQKMQMHNQVQKQLTKLLDEPSTTQKVEDRERLIRDYFNALSMFVIQNKIYYDEFEKPQYVLQKELGLIKRKTDGTAEMEENIATKLANLKNNFDGVNDNVDMFEQSGMLKYLAIESSKTSDFRTLKWVGPPLKKDTINSYSSEFRYFANLQNEDYAEVKDFFRSLHKAVYLSYGENRSPRSFLPLVPTEIHAEFMIPYIDYFFEQMKDDKVKDANSLLYKFIMSFNETFKSNHPKYFKRFTGERLGDKRFVDMRLKTAKSNYVVPNPILDYEDVPVIFPLEDEDEDGSVVSGEERPSAKSPIVFKEEPTSGYKNRTIKNASADATIAIAVDFTSAGERLTKSSVLSQNKKYIALDANNLNVTQERVNKIVNELNSIKNQSSSVANIPQNLVSGVESFGTKQEANSKAKELLGNSPHSIDMIEAGIRTRTTRSAKEMGKYNIKVGDIVKQFGKSADGSTKNILTIITAIHPKGTPGFLETWSKEGWTQKGIEAIERFKDGAAAVEFEIVKPSITLNIAGNGIYTMKGKYTQQQVDDFTYDLLEQVLNSPNLNNRIESIRSGGQTGFDEAGAKAGVRLGVPTLILAPKGWTFRNELGKDISNESQFKARFNGIVSNSVNNDQDDTLEDRITAIEYRIRQYTQELDTYLENRDTMPDEIILSFMPKINSTSAKKETGLTVGTTKDINPSKISKSKDAPSVEVAAGRIWEELPEGQQERVSEQYIRYFIIEYLTDNKNKNSYEKGLREQINNLTDRLMELQELSDIEMEEDKARKAAQEAGMDDNFTEKHEGELDNGEIIVNCD